MSYQSIWQPRRDQILALAEQVRVQYPGDWAATNDEHAAHRDRYIRRVAWVCRNVAHPDQPTWTGMIGCNWKRGQVGALSLDAMAMPNETGARDRTGGLRGLELVDIITNHGRANASIGWGDVTQVTIDSGNGGGWIKATDPDTTTLPGLTPALPATAPKPAYPDEPSWWKPKFQTRVKQAYVDAKRAFPDPNDPDAFRRFARCGFDIGTGRLTNDAAADHHIRELREELGVANIPEVREA